MADFNLGFADEKTVVELSRNHGEPRWLLEDRKSALERFKALPVEDHPLYSKHSGLRDSGVAESVPYLEPTAPPRTTDCNVEDIAGFFHQSGQSLETLSLDPSLKSKGVTLSTFQDYAVDHSETLRSWLTNRSRVSERDKFAQMTRALFMTGVVFHVPDNVVIRKPVLLQWSAGRSGTALLSRTLVVLGRHAGATVIENLEQDRGNGGTVQSLFGGTTQIVLGEASKLSFHGIENPGSGTTAIMSRDAEVSGGSEVDWALGHVGGNIIKSRVDNMLIGRGATVKEVDVLYGNGSQSFDLVSYTRHLAEDTVSDLLSKGVLQDQSRAYTKGLITIEKGGGGSDSYLGEFGMVLSRDARFLAIPSLEIENHSVRRAKHSSSVAQIDDRQLFYLMTRGIDEAEARKLIVMGFLEPVVARVPLESVAARLRNLLESKWAG